MTLRTKLISSFAMFAFVVAVLAPAGAHAATKITISGNGADSYNKVKISKAEKKKARKARKAARQKNKNKIKNMISVSQNTGQNSADKNTGGGNVDLTSGDATATVKVTNKTTGNTATGDNCGCVEDDSLTIKVKDNGADSTNKVYVSYGSDGYGGSGVSKVTILS